MTETSTVSGSTSTITRAFTWDASGRLTGDGRLSLEYSPTRRVSAISHVDHGRTRYTTHSLGQRVRKIASSGQVTDTVWGDEELGTGSKPLAHIVSPATAGTPQSTEYLYLPTASGPMPLAVQIDGQLFAIDSDHLNTPRRITNQANQLVWQWVTSGFGEVPPTQASNGFVDSAVASAPAVNNPGPIQFNLRYPGQTYDQETGWSYNHHRYYDPLPHRRVHTSRPYRTGGRMESVQLCQWESDGGH